MRTPRCRAAGLLLLALALPFSGFAMSARVRGPKAGPPDGLTTSVAGVVVDERGKPVAGAEVEAVVSDLLWDPERQQVRTDATGRFLISGIEEGRPCTLREVQLTHGWPLTGNLLGVEPEQALNARVEAARQDGEVRQGRVDRDGTYRIDDLEPGIWTVKATIAWRQNASGTVEILEGGASLDLKIPALQEVSGRLLDPKGNPVSGWVKLTGKDGISRQATSKEDGTFSIEIAEGTYLVEGSGGSWAPTVLAKPVAVGERPVEGLEILLKPGAVLQGRVLGLPAGEGARVSLNPDHPPEWPVWTEPDGGYRISGLKPGDWQVEVAVWMEDVRRIWRSQVTLAPGETEKNLDLDPRLGTLTLSGRLDHGDEPLSTHVALLTPDGQPLTEDLLIEDAEGGAFQIPALRPGSYVLRIKDYYRDRVVLKPVEITSDQTVTIDLLHP